MLKEIFNIKSEGKTIGITASTFDLLHAGHCAMLSEAKAKCDYLIVALMSDPTIDRPDTKNKPVQTMFERWVQLASLSSVDMIVPYETEVELVDMLKLIQPDIRIIGEEYKGTNFTGHDIEGIENYYNAREHSFSTSNLRERVTIANNTKGK